MTPPVPSGSDRNRNALGISTQRVTPGRFPESLTRHLLELQRDGFLARLRDRRTDLWNPEPAHQAVAANRLGWVDPRVLIELHGAHLAEWAREARTRFTTVVLFGMGGSSLAPDVIARVVADPANAARFLVLDSTDPDAVAEALARTAGETLYLVSSKSGGTIETRSHAEFFWSRASADRPDAGTAFAAITDPDSPLARLAKERGFGRVFLNAPDIGGRYSALSLVGLVPAALLDVAPAAIAERVRAMLAACGPDAPTYENPALVLGTLIAVSALSGADKLTLLTSPALAPLAGWVEQLIAESTGKDGRGIIPVAGESPQRAMRGSDRCVVILTLDGDDDPMLAKTVDRLRDSGTPLVEIALPDRLAVFGEFYKWEVATAVASSLLRVDPFDEPNVKESKDMTASILTQVEQSGHLPVAPPTVETERLAIWAAGAAPGGTAESAIADLIKALKPRMYLGLLAYLHATPDVEAALGRVRAALGESTGVPVLFGWGPRYLHSIGQLYKGGPKSGVFLIVTSDHVEDFDIPNARYTFGQLQLAQALGDVEALRKHDRPTLRIHLKGERAAALAALERAVSAALG